MDTFKIITYCTDTGKSPFVDWRDNLDTKTRSIVLTRIARVRISDFGDCKKLKNGEGLWELRIRYGPGYRIYFGEEDAIAVILLLGGDKGSQHHDIEKAKQFWLEYKESCHA